MYPLPPMDEGKPSQCKEDHLKDSEATTEKRAAPKTIQEESELLSLASTTTTTASSNAIKPKMTRKRRKVKHKKPENMPSRPLSAYNIFFREERLRWLKERKEQQAFSNSDEQSKDDEDTRPIAYNKDLKKEGTFHIMGRAIAARWKKLSLMERKQYIHSADEDMVRYRREMEEYNDMMVRESIARRAEHEAQQRNELLQNAMTARHRQLQLSHQQLTTGMEDRRILFQAAQQGQISLPSVLTGLPNAGFTRRHAAAEFNLSASSAVASATRLTQPVASETNHETNQLSLFLNLHTQRLSEGQGVLAPTALQQQLPATLPDLSQLLTQPVSAPVGNSNSNIQQEHLAIVAPDGLCLQPRSTLVQLGSTVSKMLRNLSAQQQQQSLGSRAGRSTNNNSSCISSSMIHTLLAQPAPIVAPPQSAAPSPATTHPNSTAVTTVSLAQRPDTTTTTDALPAAYAATQQQRSIQQLLACNPASTEQEQQALEQLLLNKLMEQFQHEGSQQQLQQHERPAAAATETDSPLAAAIRATAYGHQQPDRNISDRSSTATAQPYTTVVSSSAVLPNVVSSACAQNQHGSSR